MDVIKQLESTALAESFAGGGIAPGDNGANWSTGNLLSLDGFLANRRKQSDRRRIQIAEASKLWVKFAQGKIAPYLMMEAVRSDLDTFANGHEFVFRELHNQAPSIFNEAMTRGDFTNLTTYVLDRLMFQNYSEWPKTYTEVCKIHPTVKDFRAVERWQTDGGERVYQKVGELSNFNRQAAKTGKYTYQVYKYELGDQISWEATINDDMSMFTDLPQRLTLGGIRTIEQFWLSLIASSTGPNSAFFGTAIALVTGGTLKNTIDLSGYSSGTFTGTVNPVLNVINVILGAGLLMNQATAEGRPINPNADELNIVVGDGVLYQTLNHIVNTDQIVTTVLGGTKATSSVTSDLAMQAKNWIRGKIKPIYCPELRNIVTTNLATSWWMFAKPGAGRPAIELGFLSGYEAPQLYRKLPNTVRAGGGGSVEEFGDFESMSTEFKGLVVFGGTRMDPRMAMASNGTAS